MRLFCSVLFCLSVLSGCGNTGELYLPEATKEAPKKIPRITGPESNTSDKSDKDDESETETKP